VADQTLNPSPWRRALRGRVLVAAGLFAAWGAGIEGRLVQLQIVDHQELELRAQRQSTRVIDVLPKRGEILDAEGKVLARSVEQDAIVAFPTEIADKAATARALCQALDDCTRDERDDIAGRLSQERFKYFAYVRRANRVSPQAAARVKALKLPGIGFMKEPRRYYPNQELAAHLLGYVGTDNRGLSGIEATYNSTICGSAGKVLMETDGNRQPFASIGVAPTPGASLQLTIDSVLQWIAESELQAAVEYHHAAGGAVVVMDPHTGDILALANAPTFNPNKYSEARELARRNRAVQDVYEPGSTFKIVTASAALEEHVMSPADPIDVSAGSIKIGSRKPIADTHRYGVLSFSDVLVKSSNVGAVKIGLKLGADRLGRYVQRFGFGTRLSPDFPSENAGLLWDPAGWDDSTLASVSMGYQVSVTPLQMATAASVVANGGELIQPRVLKAWITPDGRRAEIPRKAPRRVIQQSTADQLTTIMEGVVERGTATAARIPGFSIAGKTGTAAKLEENLHYSKSDYNASFVGFIPSRNPVLTIIVVLDSPHGHGYYGGAVSAPVFKRIAEKAMQHLGIPPNLDTAPSILFVSRRPAAPQVHPAGPSRLRQAAVVPAVSSQGSAPSVVPDVVGLGAREAIRMLAAVGMTPRVSGDGVVLQQEPRPGSPLEPGARCSLSLGRLSSVPPTAGDQRQ
jgi:cell division protein FtsI (penicillin-binding protein 3)